MLSKDTYQTLLRVEEELPGAVVFGGFLRDTLLGLAPRDIDIAVPANRHDLNGLGFSWGIHDQEERSYEHDRIHRVWVRDDWNVIEHACFVSAEGQNEYVDIGICKVAWSHAEGLILHPRFLRDVMNQTLTIYRTDWGQEGVQQHLERLKKKFRGYTVVTAA